MANYTGLTSSFAKITMVLYYCAQGGQIEREKLDQLQLPGDPVVRLVVANSLSGQGELVALSDKAIQPIASPSAEAADTLKPTLSG